ncbi:MAG: hypothetical protein C0598_00940 [Marinilabiliales bacterium]|nr:MAG: hypothetical protein C0598_00940 [Marinilabiliales bacterium]
MKIGVNCMKIIRLYFATVIFLITVLSSCTSSSKHLERGNYDKAISKSVSKLLKNPDKLNEIRNLKKAYALANKKDVDRIKQLQLSGQPDIYDDLVSYYSGMMRRQESVERLPDEILAKLKFEHVDYNNQIVEAKKKAAEYFYARGSQLLETNDKINARKAYSDFMKVKKYFPAYYQIDDKIRQAEAVGINNVIFYLSNESRTALPKDFENEILKISLKTLNKQWLNFDTREWGDLFYDYSIYLTLKEIVVSPELVKEVHYTEVKTIQDGFDYVLDENGNVKKDTSGNDIKVPRYKEISCDIIETRMNKSSRVGGSLDFYDNRGGQLIKTMPVISEFVFESYTAAARGNLDALKEETRKKVGMKPLPFPTDLQIIFDTNEDLKERVKRIISSNRNILLN